MQGITRTRFGTAVRTTSVQSRPLGGFVRSGRPRPNLAHPAVECVVPTLIQEAGPRARPVEEKLAELAALPAEIRLAADEVEAIRELGDNTGSMLLKGASPDHEGEERADRWPIRPEQEQLAAHWGIEIEALRRRAPVAGG